MKYGHNNKKKCKNACNDLFIQVSWSYVYFFKSYCVLQNKKKRRDKKKVHKKKNKVITQLLEACVSLSINYHDLFFIVKLLIFFKGTIMSQIKKNKLKIQFSQN